MSKRGRLYKILIVDDSKPFRIWLKSSLAGKLSEKYHRIDEAESIEEAQDKLGLDNYDLCILDLGLPGCMGSESIDRIQDADPNVSIVVVTGNEDPDVLMSVFSRGVRVVNKNTLNSAPVDSDRNNLPTTVMSCLSKHNITEPTDDTTIRVFGRRFSDQFVLAVVLILIGWVCVGTTRAYNTKSTFEANVETVSKLVSKVEDLEKTNVAYQNAFIKMQTDVEWIRKSLESLEMSE